MIESFIKLEYIKIIMSENYRVNHIQNDFERNEIMSLFLAEIIQGFKPLEIQHHKSKIKTHKLKEKYKNFQKLAIIKREKNLSKPYPIKAMNTKKKILPYIIPFSNFAMKLEGVSTKALNSYIKKDSEAVIFAPAHICKHDIQTVFKYTKEQAVILLEGELSSKNTIDEAFLKICGVNFVDLESEKDRKTVLKKIERDLENNFNVLWFPEGAWNLSENLMIQPIRYSIIELSKKTNKKIVPIGIERFNNVLHIKFGKPYIPSDKLSKVEAANELRDILASLKWDILEKQPTANRKDFEKTHWAKVLLKQLKEFPATNYMIEQSHTLQRKGDSYEFFEEFNYSIRYINGEKIVRRISSEGRYKL